MWKPTDKPDEEQLDQEIKMWNGKKPKPHKIMKYPVRIICICPVSNLVLYVCQRYFRLRLRIFVLALNCFPNIQTYVERNFLYAAVR